MPCAHCGSTLECAYVVEWIGDEDAVDTWVDRKRHRGSLVVAMPIALGRASANAIAMVDIPVPTSAALFRADPQLWDPTRFAMVTRRRSAAPCLAFEKPNTARWIANGLLGALRDQAFVADLLPEDRCTFTLQHACARLRLCVEHYAEEGTRWRVVEGNAQSTNGSSSSSGSSSGSNIVTTG